MKKPVGRMTAAEVRPDGIYATFKLSRSTGGNDALIQAQEGLVSGLSVGAVSCCIEAITRWPHLSLVRLTITVLR